MDDIFKAWHIWLWPVSLLLGSVGLALAANYLLFRLLRAWANLKSDLLTKSIVRHGRGTV